MDTATAADEASWYRSEDDWPTIRDFCKSWQGNRDLGMVSVFDRSLKMCNEWANHGHAAYAYDISHNGVNMDICTRVGFYFLLSLLLRMAPGSFSMWAPPCSLFIFLTSSLHRRHVFGAAGDVTQFAVRLSNLISSNCAMALKAALKFRPDCHVVVEQPSGSWLFKADVWKEIIQGFWLKKTLTYQGLFGGPLPKPTHLLHSFAADGLFARKLTKKLRESKKFKKAQKIYYVKDQAGSVTGTKMLTTLSVYPKRFTSVIYKAWVANSRQPLAAWPLLLGFQQVWSLKTMGSDEGIVQVIMLNPAIQWNSKAGEARDCLRHQARHPGKWFCMPPLFVFVLHPMSGHIY